MSRFQWIEDDFDPPAGAQRLETHQPDNNRTYIMYHGTTKDNAKAIHDNGFRQSEDGMLGPGVYLSRDLQKASHYPIRDPPYPDEEKAVLKVKVNVGKVKKIDCQRHPMRLTWHDHGYDTAWVPPNCGMVKSGREENCVWDPKRINVIRVIKPTPVSGQNSGSYK